MKKYTAAAIAWLSILRSTTAAPQTHPSSSEFTDQCGPSVSGHQDPKVSDTCTARPAIVSTPSSFGIVGILPDSGHYSPLVGQPSDSDLTTYDYNWATCAPVVQQICSQMSNNSTAANKWYFVTVKANGNSEPCQMGFWLPDNNTMKGDREEAALKPTEQQCQNIFNATLSAATNSQDKWIGASINLVKNPASQPGQFALPNSAGTGAAANQFYPSYLIAAGIPCVDPLTKLGCHCASDGKTCASNKLPPSSSSLCQDSNRIPCPCAADGKTCQADSNPPKTCTDNTSGKPCRCAKNGNTCQICLNMDNGEQCPCSTDGITCIGAKPVPKPTCQDIAGARCTCAADGQTCVSAGSDPVGMCHTGAGAPCPCAADGETCAAAAAAPGKICLSMVNGQQCPCAADGVSCLSSALNPQNTCKDSTGAPCRCAADGKSCATPSAGEGVCRGPGGEVIDCVGDGY